MVDHLITAPVTIGSATFPNPVWLASGTAGFGEELAEIIPLEMAGGLVLKGTTIEPRPGNPPPRLVETPAGLLNAIGLQNPGIDAVLSQKIPLIRRMGIPLILNIAGKSVDDYVELARRATDPAITALEVNMSCPNVASGLDNGTDPRWIESVIRHVKRETTLPIIAKLTPNVTDITQLALAAEAGGADAVSLINTLLGMAFDIKTGQPKLANKMGGLSGPAIRPVAIRMVYQVRQKTQLPIVGMGGIMNLDDIREFFIAGASAVQLGTLNFIDIQELTTILKFSSRHP